MTKTNDLIAQVRRLKTLSEKASTKVRARAECFVALRTAAPALADAVEARDSMIDRLATALEEQCVDPARFGLELVDGKWRIRET